MKARYLLSAAAAAVAICAPSHAAILLTTGAGSAVTSADATADFESQAALSGNPYTENGLAFSRTNLTFNNNNCGYAGCAGGFPYFSGNYMYGVSDEGVEGYFTISSGANIFSGLEFQIGNGFAVDPQSVIWSAYRNGVLVGSGTDILAKGSVVGFSGSGGFDTLRYTQRHSQVVQYAPAFDSVRAEFLTGAVPEPATWAMMIAGFGAVGFALRRRRQGFRVAYSA